MGLSGALVAGAALLSKLAWYLGLILAILGLGAAEVGGVGVLLIVFSYALALVPTYPLLPASLAALGGLSFLGSTVLLIVGRPDERPDDSRSCSQCRLWWQWRGPDIRPVLTQIVHRAKEAYSKADVVEAVAALDRFIDIVKTWRTPIDRAWFARACRLAGEMHLLLSATTKAADHLRRAAVLQSADGTASQEIGERLLESQESAAVVRADGFTVDWDKWSGHLAEVGEVTTGIVGEIQKLDVAVVGRPKQAPPPPRDLPEGVIWTPAVCPNCNNVPEKPVICPSCNKKVCRICWNYAGGCGDFDCRCGTRA